MDESGEGDSVSECDERECDSALAGEGGCSASGSESPLGRLRLHVEVDHESEWVPG